MDTKKRKNNLKDLLFGNQERSERKVTESDFLELELDGEQSKKIEYVLSKIDDEKIDIEAAKELLIRNVEYIDLIMRYSGEKLNQIIPIALKNEKNKESFEEKLKEIAKREIIREREYIINKLEELYPEGYPTTEQTVDIQIILSEFDFDPREPEMQPSREEVIDLLVENIKYLDVIKELSKEELGSTIYNAIEAKDKKIFFEEIARKIERGEIAKREDDVFMQPSREERIKKEEARRLYKSICNSLKLTSKEQKRNIGLFVIDSTKKLSFKEIREFFNYFSELSHHNLQLSFLRHMANIKSNDSTGKMVEEIMNKKNIDFLTFSLKTYELRRINEGIEIIKIMENCKNDDYKNITEYLDNLIKFSENYKDMVSVENLSELKEDEVRELLFLFDKLKENEGKFNMNKNLISDNLKNIFLHDNKKGEFFNFLRNSRESPEKIYEILPIFSNSKIQTIEQAKKINNILLKIEDSSIDKEKVIDLLISNLKYIDVIEGFEPNKLNKGIKETIQDNKNHLFTRMLARLQKDKEGQENIMGQ